MRKLIRTIRQKLINAGIEPQEAVIEADLLMEFVSGATKKDIILNKEIPIDEAKLNTLLNNRINEKVPVQYLINKAYFMGEEFYVDENVLIPRPETEILVEKVLCHCERSEAIHPQTLDDGLFRRTFGAPRNDDSRIKILDLGTGSGCIAIMLALKLPNAQIYASDISEKALKIAINNAKKLKVIDKITYIQSDIMKNICEKFDIIVSNPPYISAKDKQNLQIEVQKHEPHLALFVDDEQGISFYEKLANQARQHLNPDGRLVVEVGLGQAAFVKEILKNNDFMDIEIIQDLSGIERVVSGKTV